MLRRKLFYQRHTQCITPSGCCFSSRRAIHFLVYLICIKNSEKVSGGWKPPSLYFLIMTVIGCCVAVNTRIAVRIASSLNNVVRVTLYRVNRSVFIFFNKTYMVRRWLSVKNEVNQISGFRSITCALKLTFWLKPFCRIPRCLIKRNSAGLIVSKLVCTPGNEKIAPRHAPFVTCPRPDFSSSCVT